MIIGQRDKTPPIPLADSPVRSATQAKAQPSLRTGAGGVGGLVAVSIDGDFYFPGYDNNGNVIGSWDESGSIVAEYAYDAFGNTISSSGSMADVFTHRFSTKYYDAETDLYYYGYRYYSPSLGRWICRDPMEERESGCARRDGSCYRTAAAARLKPSAAPRMVFSSTQKARRTWPARPKPRPATTRMRSARSASTNFVSSSHGDFTKK